MWVGAMLRQYVCTSSYVSPPPPQSAVQSQLNLKSSGRQQNHCVGPMLPSHWQLARSTTREMKEKNTQSTWLWFQTVAAMVGTLTQTTCGSLCPAAAGYSWMCQMIFLTVSMGSCTPLDIGEHHTAETVHKLSLYTHFINCAINYYSIPVRLTLLMCTLTF